MKFRYEFDIQKLRWPVGHTDKLLLIGSCFTENITDKLRKYKFRVEQNPHGILFNPASVTHAIGDYLKCRTYKAEELFCLNESFHSWDHHSRFSAVSAEDAIQKINDSISSTHKYLKSTDFLFITLGSAWVYQLTEKAPNYQPHRVAANNHKAPADWFNRKLLSAAEVRQSLQQVLRDLLAFNRDLKVIFTISPVRHLREGVVDNNRSKAVLIQAVHDVISEFENTYYFPAYELVIDDLRDYRFFAEDLVHPNYFATEYVWERLLESCISDESVKLIAELHKINLAFQHKPFNASSTQHKKFMATYLAKAIELQQQHPYLNLDPEIRYFSTGVH